MMISARVEQKKMGGVSRKKMCEGLAGKIRIMEGGLQNVPFSMFHLPQN